MPDNHVTQELLNSVAINHDNKQLDKWVMKRKEMLDTDSDSVSVIYVHCDGGSDRAGEMIAGYRMKYGSNTYAESIDSSDNECTREQNVVVTNGTKWCWPYLEKNQVRIKIFATGS